MKTPGILEIEASLQQQRDRMLEIAFQHGAKNVRLLVRVEAQPNSDLALLVALDESLSPWFPVGLIQALEALLGHKVDVLTVKDYFCSF